MRTPRTCRTVIPILEPILLPVLILLVIGLVVSVIPHLKKTAPP